MRAQQPATPTASKKTALQKFAAPFVVLLATAMMITEREVERARTSRLWQDTRANVDASRIGAVALIIVGSVLAAVVGVRILASLAPEFFSSLASLVTTFTDENTTTGDPTGDAFLPIAGLVLSIVGALALFGIAITVLFIRMRRSS